MDQILIRMITDLMKLAKRVHRTLTNAS